MKYEWIDFYFVLGD